MSSIKQERVTLSFKKVLQMLLNVIECDIAHTIGLIFLGNPSNQSASVESGCGINPADLEGSTPLHEACRFGHRK